MTGAIGSNTWWKRVQRLGSIITVGLAVAATVRAADIKDIQRDLLEGRYDDVISQASAILSTTPNNSEASMLLIQAQLTLGHNVDAYIAMNAALSRDTQSIRLKWLSREVAFANGKPDEAAKRVDEIRKAVQSSPWSYRSPADMVVFGRTLLLLGVDPKDVLDKMYGTAMKADPKNRDVYLARGDLALEKHDFALAAKAYDEGLKVLPDDPDLLAGRGKAFASGEREVALESWRSALKINSRHVPSLLQLANHHIDAEEYDSANTVLDNVIAVNPTHPEAWAYRAVIAHLKNDSAGEETARDTALSTWARNPRVDSLIGEKLSAKYRFAEGAAYQRRAREFDPSYLPAMAQLASDLLRLGQEAEGWALAKAVHDRDEYDVEAFNLVTLRETMSKYASMADEDFIVRMAAPEVAAFGPRVMALLRRAQQTLVTKYGVELARPTIVEIFADEKDFAVRTFGLPDVPGFLGVCFGRVVTANSPSTRNSPTNWESVLWHEFCHVVTLQSTKNKMPRWLSEGISVYEEWQADPSWGMRLDPRYRAMMLGDELVPVGKLSGAFLAPKSSAHLQFAYLQSAVVVEYIINKYGIASIRRMLADLREGVEINTTLARHTAELPVLEKEFAVYARERASKVGPKLDWAKPEPELMLPENALDLLAWEQKHPDNYWLIRHRTQQLMELERWNDVRVQLQRLIELYPEQKGSDTAYRPLVAAVKAMGDTTAEKTILHQWVKIDDEAPDAYLRLMELATQDRDWTTVADNADRYLKVNPLIAAPYRYLAKARTEQDDLDGAVAAWQTLLQFDVPDKSDAHYQLGTLLYKRGDKEGARRHTLMSLEETPRYRDALRLLVDLKRGVPATPPAGAAAPPAAPGAEQKPEANPVAR
jgi:tetratricopeptide (TPR) repeat protein